MLNICTKKRRKRRRKTQCKTSARNGVTVTAQDTVQDATQNAVQDAEKMEFQACKLIAELRPYLASSRLSRTSLI